MNNSINQVALLRTSREFPEELHQLAQESNKAYVDVATAINARTIGLYPINRPAQTGNTYFLSSQRQQSLRQVFTFKAAGAFTHNINVLTSSQILSTTYGSFTDGTNYYGCIYASNVAIPGQVSFYITPNSAFNKLDGTIVVLAGAGSPTIKNGIIVIEYLAQP